MGGFMKFAKTFLDRLRVFEQFLCFTAFMVMAGALVYDVLKRQFTGSGAFGAPQLGVIGMIVVSYIGIGLASAAGPAAHGAARDQAVRATRPAGHTAA